jgi:hypothetical protein
MSRYETFPTSILPRFAYWLSLLFEFRVRELSNRSAYQIQCVIVVILNLVFTSLPKSQEDSDPVKYRRVVVSTLLHASVHDFTTFAECIDTDCK